MDFPNLVYKAAGPYARPGGTYAYKPVANDEELSAAMADGWFCSLAEAVAYKDLPTYSVAKVDEVIPAIDAPPTRQEMEAKAKELGIKFDGRTTDKVLLSKIEAALTA